MPSNPIYAKNYTVTILVALAILNTAGFLALYFKYDLDQSRGAQQVAMLEAQISKLQPSAAMPTNPTPTTENTVTEYQNYIGWDLAFAVPKTFSVAKVENPYQSGQTDVRITSQPGSLYLSSGGPMNPGKNDFTSGYQMIISRFIAGQDPIGKSPLVATSNSLVKKINFICDGAGCPAAQYVVTSKQGKYLIEVRASDDYLSKVDDVTNDIVNSIKE